VMVHVMVMIAMIHVMVMIAMIHAMVMIAMIHVMVMIAMIHVMVMIAMIHAMIHARVHITFEPGKRHTYIGLFLISEVFYLRFYIVQSELSPFMGFFPIIL